MKGKITGGLCLIGFGILMKNQNLHAALNQMVEERVRKVANWIRGAKSPGSRLSSAESANEPTATPEKKRRKKRAERKENAAKPWAKRQASQSRRVARIRVA